MGENAQLLSVDELKEQAAAAGLENNYYFRTTFERYQVQLFILKGLEERIREDGMLVTKEYVKGRENIYTNPAVADYNRTTDSANKTVSTLIRIIKSLGGEKEEDADPLADAIGGNE